MGELFDNIDDTLLSGRCPKCHEHNIITIVLDDKTIRYLCDNCAYTETWEDNIKLTEGALNG